MRLRRDELPQIPKDQLKYFMDYCMRKGVFSRKFDIPVKDLKPIQKHVDREKVDKFKREFNKSCEHLQPLLTSKDRFVMDGHHRWLAAKEINPQFKYPCLEFDCSIAKLICLGHEFDGSFIKSIHEAATYKQIITSIWNIN